MATLNSTKILAGETQSLDSTIAVISPTDAPILTMLMAKPLITRASDVKYSWREKKLGTVRGLAALEGANAPAGEVTDRAILYNTCQIFSKVAEVTKTMQNVKLYEIDDALDSETSDRATEMKIDGEYYVINGTRKDDETGGTGRQMNGLLNMVSNVIDLGALVAPDTGKLTRAHIESGFKAMWEAGVDKKTVYTFVNGKTKGLINALYQGGKTGTFQEGAGLALGITVDLLTTDFGSSNIVLNRYVPDGVMLTVDIDGNVNYIPLRDAMAERLAKTGDSTKNMLTWEFTLELLNRYAGFKIIGITGV